MKESNNKNATKFTESKLNKTTIATKVNTNDSGARAAAAAP